MKTIRVLFVCMGNICRSPAAEGVMKDRIQRLKLQQLLECDSAGMIGYHAGEMYDSRMRAHALKRGISLEGRSRQFIFPDDFLHFDYILAMDHDNLEGLLKLSKGQFDAKIALFTSYLKTRQAPIVPDPYYGGDKGFEEVLDIVEDGVDGFLNTIS